MNKPPRISAASKFLCYCLFWSCLALVWHSYVGLPRFADSSLPNATPSATVEGAAPQRTPFLRLASIAGIGDVKPALIVVGGRPLNVQAFFWQGKASDLAAALKAQSAGRWMVAPHAFGKQSTWAFFPTHQQLCGDAAAGCGELTGPAGLKRYMQESYLVSLLPLADGLSVGFVLGFGDFNELTNTEGGAHEQETITRTLAGLPVQVKVDYKLVVAGYHVETVQGTSAGKLEELAAQAEEQMQRLGFKTVPTTTSVSGKGLLKKGQTYEGFWIRGGESVQLTIEPSPLATHAWIRMQRSQTQLPS